MLSEGRGFLVRHGVDTPWSGWMGVRALDAKVSLRTAPWRALGALAEACGLFPGGLSLVWDGPASWLQEIGLADRGAFLGLLGRLPGLTLHVKDEDLLEGLEAPMPGWYHGPKPPTGSAGHAWRQGRIGWVPCFDERWALPEGGTHHEIDEVFPSGVLWGEVILPVGALLHLVPDDLARLLADIQARQERALSHRVGEGAWPEVFPFQRRRAGWRLALLGGREFALSGGKWEEAAPRARALRDTLQDALRCPVHLGASDALDAAVTLGQQAMREGLPWQGSLPLPPEPAAFSTGLAADPRESYPLEARAQLAHPMAGTLDHPMVAHLRIPTMPSEAAAGAFVRGLSPLPALRWLPPDVPPPGPFLPERPWPQPSAYVPVADVTSALQPRLFDELEWG